MASSPDPARTTNQSLSLHWIGTGAFLVIVLAVTAVRLGVIAFSPLGLGPDEAQYWRWGQSFDWGYFSKPPLVGWLAGASSAVAGDTAFGVRWPAPLMHAIGAAGVWMLARQTLGGTAAPVAGLLYLLSPGVTLSASVLSTDALLLPLSAWALVAAQRMRTHSGFMPALALGGLIGLAGLGKYAAAYVVIGLMLGACLDKPLRAALLSRRGVVAALALLAVLVPNLIWNAANGGDTFRHTGANANFGDLRFSLEEPVSWLGEQFGVLGLIVFPIGMWAAFAALRKRDHPLGWLAPSAIVPVAAVLALAWLSRANANWAAVALVPLCVLTTGWLQGRGGRRLVTAALAAQVAVLALFSVAAVRPALADRLGLSSAIADVRGWDELSAQARQAALGFGVDGVVVDTRALFHGLDFAGQDWLGEAAPELPLRMWRLVAEPRNTAESTAALSAGQPGRWLLLSLRPAHEPWLRADFATMREKGEISIALGPKRRRTVRLYLVEGYTGTTRAVAPLKEDDARGGL